MLRILKEIYKNFRFLEVLETNLETLEILELAWEILTICWALLVHCGLETNLEFYSSSVKCCVVRLISKKKRKKNRNARQREKEESGRTKTN